MNFAQGEFLLVGAWVCWWLSRNYQVPFIWAMLLTFGLHAGCSACCCQVVVLRPHDRRADHLRDHGDDRRCPSSSSADEMDVRRVRAAIPAGRSRPRTSISAASQVQTVYLMSLAHLGGMMVGLRRGSSKLSKHGLAMRATAFDQQVAQSLGISVKSVFAMAWAISAMVSAVAGVVVGIVNGVSVGALRLRHQGVSGGDSGRARQRRRRGAGRHDHRAAGELRALCR